MAAEAPVDCSQLPNGDYANPDDPSSFYSCVWGQAHLRQCPKPLHFDPALRMCSWPKNAGAPAAESTV
ncbi:carbohydrate-binding module family 14 protein [Streptomyces decoyicus]